MDRFIFRIPNKTRDTQKLLFDKHLSNVKSILKKTILDVRSMLSKEQKLMKSSLRLKTPSYTCTVVFTFGKTLQDDMPFAMLGADATHLHSLYGYLMHQDPIQKVPGS